MSEVPLYLRERVLEVEEGWKPVMSVREPGSLSRANGAYLVVDHSLRGWRLMKKRKQDT